MDINFDKEGTTKMEKNKEKISQTFIRTETKARTLLSRLLNIQQCILITINRSFVNMY